MDKKIKGRKKVHVLPEVNCKTGTFFFFFLINIPMRVVYFNVQQCKKKKRLHEDRFFF